MVMFPSIRRYVFNTIKKVEEEEGSKHTQNNKKSQSRNFFYSFAINNAFNRIDFEPKPTQTRSQCYSCSLSSRLEVI